MDKHILYHDLLEAIQHDQCPVCHLVEDRMKRTIQVLVREGAADGETVASYVRAKGFCNTHAWQVKEAGNPASQAVLYRALLEEHKAALKTYLRRRSGRLEKSTGLNRLRSLLHISLLEMERTSDETKEYLNSFASDEPCPLCITLDAAERRYVEGCVDYFEGDEEFRERYRNRGILCHPHFRRMVEEHAHRGGAQQLMEIQLDRLDLYIAHLREIERRSYLPYSEEQHAAYRGGWTRAVRLEVGSPGTDTQYKRRVDDQKSALIKP